MQAPQTLKFLYIQKNKMFQQLPILNFEDIVDVNDKLVMDAIVKISNADIAVAIINSSTELRAKLFKNMSLSRARIIREDMLSQINTYTQRGSELAQKHILEIINKKIIDEL